MPSTEAFLAALRSANAAHSSVNSGTSSVTILAEVLVYLVALPGTILPPWRHSQSSSNAAF